MTKRELIEMLSDPRANIADDVIILAFNGDEEKMLPVSGMLYDNKVVELCTDDLNN